jgi:formate/nitrite transporter FocA (FNT family)
MTLSDHHEAQDARERQAPSSKVLHDAILHEGQEELERPWQALAFSGLAAGLSMGFSLIAEGLLRHYLPDAEWTPLVSKFGYSVGFLIVILGRQQLFTENTLKSVLPLLHDKSLHMLLKMCRLWGIVLAANLIGCAVMAFATVQTGVFEPAVIEEFRSIGHGALDKSFGKALISSIFAGWLIALIIWVMPYAETGRIWMIIVLTYLIGLGHLSHVIAGSNQVFALAIMGEAGWLEVLAGYTVPALIGNIIGGVALVAAINHAQVVAGESRRARAQREKELRKSSAERA